MKNISAAITAYIDEFNKPDPYNPTTYCVYDECRDILTLSIQQQNLRINIPIMRASKFCADMHPQDFKQLVINTMLSSFTLFNA